MRQDVAPGGETANGRTQLRHASDINATAKARHQRRSLQIQLTGALAALPLVFATWVFFARLLELDAVYAARAAWLTAVPVLLVIIFAPLLLPNPWPIRWRAYIVHWFCFSSLWIVAWEGPPVVYRAAFDGVEYTQSNLPYYIWWWGYFSSDHDYGARTPWFVLAEISWWVILIPIAAALIQLRRNREAQALALFGIGGALQFYNVCFYMGYGGIVEQFRNVATDSVLAPLLYWILNGLWGIAGGIASVLSFRLLFRAYVCASASGR